VSIPLIHYYFNIKY